MNSSWADNDDLEIDFDNPPIELSSKFSKFQLASIHKENDKYDELGRNISAQHRRQIMIPWTIVDFENQKYLY